MAGRAVVVERHGLLSPVIGREIPRPGKGELLLEVHATSVNYHDLVAIEGGIPGLPLGRVPFSDNSATVLACGEDVESFQPGDAVVQGFFPNWLDGPITAKARAVITGDHIDGVLQTHICVSAASVARAPSGLSHDEVATLGCASLTAWRAIMVEANVQAGQTVVIQGTGGVSLAALAFAKLAGAQVIITSSSDAKLEQARILGADILINYRKTPNWHEAVLDATHGKGADLVVEVGGGDTLAFSVAAVRTGGHISVIGVLSGAEARNFPLVSVMSKNVTVKGITVGSVAQLEAMCRAIEVTGYRPVIGATFDLRSAGEALDLFRKQTTFGKIVIRVRGP